jgi:hypothetical protein
LKLDKEGGCEGNGGEGVREEWKNIRFVDQRGRGEERSKEERRGFNLISSTRILQSSASHGNNWWIPRRKGYRGRVQREDREGGYRGTVQREDTEGG